MKRKPNSRPSPLEQALEQQLEWMSTTLRPSTVRGYRSLVRRFLNHLYEYYPTVRWPNQLRRDPHILTWLVQLHQQQPPLAASTRYHLVIDLRYLLDQLALREASPARVGLVRPEDVPRLDHYLPRPLAPADDLRLQQVLQTRDDLQALALLLMRHTGIRIGECVDLPVDCLRSLGGGRWALHVPIGKLHTERWVPVDDYVRQLLLRMRYLRTLSAGPLSPPPDAYLLPRPKSAPYTSWLLRSAMATAACEAGMEGRVTPHQLRHTYATDMLRAGVSFPAVMKLLGHSSPRMTMRYLELTQNDLQREYLTARLQPRHKLAVPSAEVPPRADLPGVIAAVQSAQHVVEMFRRQAPSRWQGQLNRVSNRLAKIAALAKNLETMNGD